VRGRFVPFYPAAMSPSPSPSASLDMKVEFKIIKQSCCCGLVDLLCHLQAT
jgi:hypothetical protein